MPENAKAVDAVAKTPSIQPELEGRSAATRSFWDERPPGAWWSWWHVPELAAAFITGVVVMTFLYGSGDGVPGYDSFYHVKMAVLLPEIGLIDKFKWLTTTVFADRFVSHHWGFHALLVPFVYAGERLAGDFVVGAKWGITFFFALSMVLFHLLLMTQRVRLRWLWLGLYLVMPAQFFGRHMFIRAIAPSLACMLLIMLLMFRHRYVWCAVVIAGYVHVYLGAVFYVPLLVGAYFAVGLLGEDGDRVSWKLPAWAIAGMLVGLVSHPYRDGIPAFLQVQVLGSGLTPDIPVGREWKSYDGKLWELVFVYFGLTLSMLVVSVVARLRTGGPLNAREAAVLVVNFVFLTMAFRQRRFIEYWPPFGLLTSAFLLAPLLEHVADGARIYARRLGAARLWLPALVLVGLTLAVGLYLLFARGRSLGIGSFVAEWPAWMFVVSLCGLVPLSRVWPRRGHRRALRLLPTGGANLCCGALLVAIVFVPVLTAFRADSLPSTGMYVPVWAWIVLGLAYVAAPWIGGAPTSDKSEEMLAAASETCRAASARAEACGSRGADTASSVTALAALTTVVTGAAFVLLLILGGAGQMVSVQRSSRCQFDLPAVRGAMAYLRDNSPPDAIVFTDDWDVFPLYFYHNHHNRYIVGLDPKFSHARDPVLWERYVKITQSKRFPVSCTVNALDEAGESQTQTIKVRLEDIRDHFGASFVITDPDHTQLAVHLEGAPHFAERVYPPETRKRARRPPFTIYRIRPPAIDN